MWFYQDMEEVEPPITTENPKPSTSRTLQSSVSKTQTVPVVKKKLFLTDGWECALTGICVYIFRINTTKQIPEEGFHKVTLRKLQVFHLLFSRNVSFNFYRIYFAA